MPNLSDSTDELLNVLTEPVERGTGMEGGGNENSLSDELSYSTFRLNCERVSVTESEQIGEPGTGGVPMSVLGRAIVINDDVGMVLISIPPFEIRGGEIRVGGDAVRFAGFSSAGGTVKPIDIRLPGASPEIRLSKLCKT